VTASAHPWPPPHHGWGTGLVSLSLSLSSPAALQYFSKKKNSKFAQVFFFHSNISTTLLTDVSLNLRAMAIKMNIEETLFKKG
jgi:hypothetical protein